MLTLRDLLTGQLSLARETFYRIGGFDTHFTRGGSFGNEDLDLGYRLLLQGYRIVFNPGAISWQYYAVQPGHHLRQSRQTGHADVAFVRKHPDQIDMIFGRIANQDVWRRVLTLPLIADPLTRLLRWLALILIDHGVQNAISTKLFLKAKAAEHWRGVQEAGGIPQSRRVSVLAYHAIADLAGCAVLGPYGVPPNVFRGQMDTLLQAGFQFIDADEFLRFLHGRGSLPRKALLLTFDDCYEELLETVLPILEERGIPAVAFAVSGRTGSTNDWDQAIGAPRLQLLDADGLRRLAQRGIEIGAHSRTHRRLTHVSTEELSEEIAGSVAELATLGIPRPRMFAYPYGQYDQRVRQAVQRAGLQAAFTVDSGRVFPGHAPYSVPRIEIMKQDVGWKLRWKIAVPDRPSMPSKALRFQLERWLQERC
jgi:peptidoglycan/xylan/chitin deacetylase (PgdA/CDA1 family)